MPVPQLVVVGPRYTANVAFDDETIGFDRSALPSLPRIIVERWLGADDWRVRLGALRSFGRLRGGGSTGDSANIKAGYGEKFVAMRDHDPHPEVAEFARRVVERIERREDDD